MLLVLFMQHCLITDVRISSGDKACDMLQQHEIKSELWAADSSITFRNITAFCEAL
jgi:hypothetical protein